MYTPRLVIACCAAWLTSGLPGRAADAAGEVDAARVEINETVTNGFVHPGIGLTKAMLENAREGVREKKEPWYSGFEMLAASPYSAKTISFSNEGSKDPTVPRSDAFDGKSIENRLRMDAAKAQAQALMYIFTGHDAHRANAMRIIRTWERMDPAKYRAYPEVYIHASWPIRDLIQAAELMRYTSAGDPRLAWTDADTRAFSGNFVVPAIASFLNYNGWFMNQNGYPLAAAMAGDIFTSDARSYARRVEWFTVNKSAPNKGWSSSIHDLARLVEVDALTGKKATEPVVQLMEMGRDQAHAGDDMEIFATTARMMNAQGTRVDPADGTISTRPDAVGPYEFLSDRILAAADNFCRFMLGYDTPWIPAPCDIGPDGKTRAIYPRIADNYRGRIREIDCWDIYYHYAIGRGVDVARKAPYYYEAFTKRIVSSPTEWLYIPKGVTGGAARVAPSEQQPDVVQVARRSTQFDRNASVLSEEGIDFVRVTPSASGTRIAILSSQTDSKTIGLRVRTTGAAEITMSGFGKAWTLPDTRGRWLLVAYTMGSLEQFRDIEYFTIRAGAGVRVDLAELLCNVSGNSMPPVFNAGSGDVSLVTFAGAPVALDFSAKDAEGSPVSVAGADMPGGASIGVKTGAFTWHPEKAGVYAFYVTATAGDAMAVRKVSITVTPDRESAVRAIMAGCDRNVIYTTATAGACREASARVDRLGDAAGAREYSEALMRLEDAVRGLEPLTPLLADGSMDFPKIVVSSNIGESIGLLTDGNNDTFPVYTLAPALNYVFDFGAGYRIAASGFTLEGRLNFADRARGTAFFGSNDGTQWTRLTKPLAASPEAMTRIAVQNGLETRRFRYLKIQKMEGGLFEPSELRIYGLRFESNR